MTLPFRYRFAHTVVEIPASMASQVMYELLSAFGDKKVKVLTWDWTLECAMLRSLLSSWPSDNVEIVDLQATIERCTFEKANWMPLLRVFKEHRRCSQYLRKFADLDARRG